MVKSVKKKFMKGPQLLSLARKKATQCGLEWEGMKMESLIAKIQEKEGYTACFRKQKTCREAMCCWQVSCGAEILVP